MREVLVYDDHSTDETPRIVGEYARRRVRLLTPKPLPAGWCGKTFACAQLGGEARGRWLLFLDADARLREGAIARAVAEAEARGVTLLSCWPALELVSFWERALMPLLNFVVFTLYPAPLALRRADSSLGLAHGSFILARRDAYERTGGHALVGAELFEDVRLAQAWRACGERGLCLDGRSVLTVRMYHSFGDIRRGFQKNFFPAFRRRAALRGLPAPVRPYVRALDERARATRLRPLGRVRAGHATRTRAEIQTPSVVRLASPARRGRTALCGARLLVAIQARARRRVEGQALPRRSRDVKTAVIVGGGLGGLATALRLAAAGLRVTVCERGPTLGGKMNVSEREGFRFDTGPSLITMPWVFEELFEACGAALKEHVELLPVNPLADYVFDDGTRFTYSTSLPEWLEVVRQLEPRDVDGFYKFMQLGARLFALSRETFLRRPPLAPPDLRVIKSLRHFPVRNAWGNYHATVAAHFRSPHLRQLYDRYPTYVGSSPYRSPATLAVIPYIEFAYGGWHVRGGLYRLVESLAALARTLGVELLTGARVERIEHEGRRVRGVRLEDGTRLPADVVVMNGDAATTASLLGLNAKAQAPCERSLSGFVLLRGVGRKLEGLAHHTVYFSSNYEREFAQLFDERRFPEDPTVYVSAPSRTDPSVAPAGGETLFVMANAPADSEVWSTDETARARVRVFERLTKGGFPFVDSPAPVGEEWTPARIAREYLSPGGAIYGTHSHGMRRAFLRPPNRDARVRGLYQVGGSSHPGGGTPTVLLSAEITCELIRKHER